MRRLLRSVLAVASLVLAQIALACPPDGWTRADMRDLSAGGFKIEEQAQRDAAALGFLECLGDPDPIIRDGVAFGAISAWLRSSTLSDATMLEMTARASAALKDKDDAKGFRRPFAALALSELARADRIKPFLDAATRAGLVDLAAAYMALNTDFRGFEDRAGWRHGVAHAADLILQLSVNPNVDAAQVKHLMIALAAKTGPIDHAYVHGEPERLARAVYFAYRRGVLTKAEWDDWFASAGDASPFATWDDTLKSETGLARRHNWIAFLQSLYLIGVMNSGEPGAEIAARARAALVKVMGG